MANHTTILLLKYIRQKKEICIQTNTFPSPVIVCRVSFNSFSAFSCRECFTRQRTENRFSLQVNRRRIRSPETSFFLLRLVSSSREMICLVVWECVATLRVVPSSSGAVINDHDSPALAYDQFTGGSGTRCRNILKSHYQRRIGPSDCASCFILQGSEESTVINCGVGLTTPLRSQPLAPRPRIHQTRDVSFLDHVLFFVAFVERCRTPQLVTRVPREISFPANRNEINNAG